MPIKPGTRIGPYEVTSPLGEGGMGVVYRAHDPKLQRDVALKLLPDHFADDAERLARFQREAQMLASLNHPNIAQIYGLEESGNTRGIVMELVEGETLQERLRRGPIPIIEEALDIATHISEALEAAHEKGIIHRDLKPANVKITPEGRVKVLDFGLAKWPEDRAIGPESATRMTDVSLTQSGQIMGTVAYMSPEQARGEKLDARTDLFSLGAVLHEMATGRNAFPKAWDWTPPPADGIDPLLYRIILKLLEADRERRYAKAAEVRADLKRLQDKLQSSQSKRRRSLILASALGLVALLVIAVIWYRPTQPPAQNQWVQLTNFPDSVSQSALSPDGRMLTFVRGPTTFFGQGQIYVKLLPDGEPVQLTRDNLYKMSPVFSPRRITYCLHRG